MSDLPPAEHKDDRPEVGCRFTRHRAAPSFLPGYSDTSGARRTRRDDVDEGSEASCCEMRKGERMDEQYLICGQCAAWRHSDDPALGTCHRHAPTPLSQTEDRVRTAALVAIWPETTADAGCCEGIHASR